MRRRLFTILAAVSLLLCMGMAFLWVRSHCTPDVAAWCRLYGDGTITNWSIHSDRGRVGLIGKRVGNGQGNLPRSVFSWLSGSSYWVPINWDPQATVPYWHLVIYTGVLPLWWTVRRHYGVLSLRNFRGKHGLCLECGYDLRATPDRCPECGTAIPANAGPSIHTPHA